MAREGGSAGPADKPGMPRSVPSMPGKGTKEEVGCFLQWAVQELQGRAVTHLSSIIPYLKKKKKKGVLGRTVNPSPREVETNQGYTYLLHLHLFTLIIPIIYCVCICVHLSHSEHVKLRGQPHGTQRQNSSHRRGGKCIYP